LPLHLNEHRPLYKFRISLADLSNLQFFKDINNQIVQAKSQQLPTLLLILLDSFPIFINFEYHIQLNYFKDQINQYFFQ
jgi:hypothetical protein